MWNIPLDLLSTIMLHTWTFLVLLFVFFDRVIPTPVPPTISFAINNWRNFLHAIVNWKRECIVWMMLYWGYNLPLTLCATLPEWMHLNWSQILELKNFRHSMWIAWHQLAQVYLVRLKLQPDSASWIRFVCPSHLHMSHLLQSIADRYSMHPVIYWCHYRNLRPQVCQPHRELRLKCSASKWTYFWSNATNGRVFQQLLDICSFALDRCRCRGPQSQMLHWILELEICRNSFSIIRPFSLIDWLIDWISFGYLDYWIRCYLSTFPPAMQFHVLEPQPTIVVFLYPGCISPEW